MSIKSSPEVKFFTTHLFEVNRRLLEPKKIVCILLAGLAGTLFLLIGGVFAALGVSYFFRNRLVKQLSKETLDSAPKKAHETFSQKIEKIKSKEIELSLLEELPNEIKLCVFNYLTVKEAARMQEVCSIMKDFVSEDREISQAQRLAKEKRLAEIKQKSEIKKDAQLIVEHILNEFRKPIQGFYVDYNFIVNRVRELVLLWIRKPKKFDIPQDSRSQQGPWQFYHLDCGDDYLYRRSITAPGMYKIITIYFLWEDNPKLIELTKPVFSGNKTELSEDLKQLQEGLDLLQLKHLELLLKHLELCFNFLAEKAWTDYDEKTIEYNGLTHGIWIGSFVGTFKDELTREIWIRSFADYLKANKDQLIKDLSDNKLVENVSLMRKKRLEKIKERRS